MPSSPGPPVLEYDPEWLSILQNTEPLMLYKPGTWYPPTSVYVISSCLHLPSSKTYTILSKLKSGPRSCVTKSLESFYFNRYLLNSCLKAYYKKTMDCVYSSWFELNNGLGNEIT